MSRKRYTEEFEVAAVKQVIDRGHTIASDAHRSWLKNYLANTDCGKMRLSSTMANCRHAGSEKKMNQQSGFYLSAVPQ